MIPRYQRILFWSLAAGILFMAAVLLRSCHQAQKRLTAIDDATPIAAPTSTNTEDITLYLANDADASIVAFPEQIAVPQDPTLRARAVLEHLLSHYTLPGSTHPLPGGPAVDDVFLLNQPAAPPTAPPTTGNPSPAQPNGQIAVVNLHPAFADSHPSGVQVEDLTLQSIIGTLHAALPHLTQVRFLVNGQPRETLAGHADLLHPYPAVDTAVHPAPPTLADSAADTP